jgi:hypothetical protein
MNVGRFLVDEKNEEVLHRKSGNLNTGPYGQCNISKRRFCQHGRLPKIDNLHVRLIFDLGKKKVNSRKELIKISKIAKFGCEML